MSTPQRASRPFAAAVLAGGQSSRMGTDKALLQTAQGRLLDRQLDLLRRLHPAELLISGRAGVDYAVSDARVVADNQPGEGPAGGLLTLLEHLQQPHLLVLAVDMPSMTSAFLESLLTQTETERGIVPYLGSGYEPLVALYPRTILSIWRPLWDAGERKLQHYLQAGVQAGCLTKLPVAPDQSLLFTNWNSPSDIPS